MALSWAQDALAVGSGGAVGFSLGLIGGGGSILAVPFSFTSSASAMHMSPSARAHLRSRSTPSAIWSAIGARAT
jgi:uncharacterized membrane protein YfcA